MNVLRSILCIMLAAIGVSTLPGEADSASASMSGPGGLFHGCEVRSLGSPGNRQLEQAVAARFRESGFEAGEIVFPAPVFVPGETWLHPVGLPEIRLYSLQPTVFRPGNFSDTEFSTSLVYLGRGGENDLMAVAGTPLQDSLVVMEFDCADAWQRVLRFGVRGVVFLAAETYDAVDTQGKMYATEVGIPRYFVNNDDAGGLRQQLLAQASRHLQAEVSAQPGTWKTQDLRTPWVIIPGTDPELEREAVLLTAPIDANCVVPELSQGAQGGANLFLLLQLFEAFRREPPARTVILAAVNAHTRNYLGERHLVWSLLVPRERLEQLQDTIADDLRVEEMLLEHYQRLSLNPPTAEDEAFLITLRDLRDTSTGRNLTVKEPIVDLARREVNLLKSQQLHLVREDLSAEDMEAQRQELEARRSKYVNVLTLFNKVGIRTVLSDLDDSELDILRSYVREIIVSRSTWADLNRRELARIERNSSIRRILGAREVSFAICLDLDWTGTQVGFSANNMFGAGRWPHKWGLNAARVAQQLRESGQLQGADCFVDAMTKQGGLPEGHFFPKSSETVSILQSGGPTPAFALRNVFGDFGRAFAPNDTFAALPAENVETLLAYVPQLLRALLADPAITAPSELIRPTGRIGTWAGSWGVQVKAFKYDDFSASVLPQLPVPGSAIILHDPADANRPPLRSGDVITGHIALTDARASWVFYGVTARSLFSNAFHFDPSFTEVDHAIDAGEAELKMSSTIFRGSPAKILALFACREFPILARENTSAISIGPISEHVYKALSGRLNAPPKKYGMTGIGSAFSTKGVSRMSGPAAVYLEPGERLKLLTSDMILALNADPRTPEGNGFLVAEELGDDFFATAVRDMSVLNRDRMENLRGTSDELARIFLDRGDAAIETMGQAAREHDYIGYLRALYEALGAHGKAYGRMTAVTNDMLKAVVFYLALMLPFCFFAEKLLFKFKRIEQEMLAFGLLFVLTFLVFRGIHPAFRIAQAPEAIFVAFVMGGLGAFVIKILHGRFEGEMQLLFKTYPGMDSGTVGYSIVGQEAMLIGVNNMKRRRIRTTLTTATVVLVTFTMLAFTSISRRMSPTIITKSKRIPYTGIMYNWPGNNRMDEATMQALRELFAGRGDIIVRRWLLPPKAQDAWIPFRAATDTGNRANLDGVLGLASAEHGFLADIPMRAGRFFSNDHAAEVILPAALARSLDITPENLADRSLRFMNRKLQVVGILDDDQFRLIKDLNQRPLMPIKSLLVQSGGDQQDLQAMAMDEEDGESGVFYVDMASLLLMPLQTAQSFGAQPYSISVRLHDNEQLWPMIDELLTVTNASKFYACSTVPFRVGDASRRSTAPGVYYVGEGYRTSIGGLAFLVIPLLISSTIILNTMLGSVFERKAEISIYNAVGLNPTHIGMFFLAESFVYSVIGSVGGYLIGQVATLLLTRTGLVSEINLNFSSLSVVYVILFTVIVVLLSTLYPCMVATKAAVPSGKRKWSLPTHDGNSMDVIFPFIYQPDLVTGLMGYLADYFGRFTEASFGDLIADLQGAETGYDDDGRPTYQIRYDLALAPFDLGVTQRARFAAAYDPKVQAYRVRLHISRSSGQDTNWATTNKPFLERMRTYLLHWRNLEPGEHATFVRRGQELFSRQAQPESSMVPPRADAVAEPRAGRTAPQD